MHGAVHLNFVSFQGNSQDAVLIYLFKRLVLIIILCIWVFCVLCLSHSA